MIQYRLLKRLDTDQSEEAVGLAYIKAGKCRLYTKEEKSEFILFKVSNLNSLNNDHFPDEEYPYEWGSVEDWSESASFDPQEILQKLSHDPQIDAIVIESQLIQSKFEVVIKTFEIMAEETTKATNLRLKNIFMTEYERGAGLSQQLIGLIWQQWCINGEIPPFPEAEYNVAILLYARAFGFPVEEYRDQMGYLKQHKHLYQSLMAKSAGWGARASLSKNVMTTLNAPVTHVWVFYQADVPERIVIVGRGLATYRNKIFTDALLTAMRVRASSRDIFNDGLISIVADTQEEDALAIDIATWGADAPLQGEETSTAAMRQLIRQLEQLEQNTGFVQIHKAKSAQLAALDRVLRKQARETKRSQVAEVSLWAPSKDEIASEEEMVTALPIFDFTGSGRRVPPTALDITPEFIVTSSWLKLYHTYYEHLIRRIQIDAQIRLDYYRQRARSHRSELEAWRKADKELRLRRWGPTKTLDQRFDPDTGLTVWLHTPTIIETEEFYETVAPSLLQSYEDWATRMEGILEGLREATKREDAPFQRLITGRLFDAALRGCELPELEDAPQIQKLYQEWAIPIADTLWFEWSRKLRALNANHSDLFTSHTTFHLDFRVDHNIFATHAALTSLKVVPYTIFDSKRSVVLFDPNRRFMVVNDASDYPQEVLEKSVPVDLIQKLIERDHKDAAILAGLLREKFIENPQEVSKQIIRKIRAQIADLPDDSPQIKQAYEDALVNAKFPHMIKRAEKAMLNSALVTLRQSLEAARSVLPQTLLNWETGQGHQDEEHLASQSSFPEQKELEARLHLLMAFGECLVTNTSIKEHLTRIFRTGPTGDKLEIYEAVGRADRTDPVYTEKWIEFLAQFEIYEAYDKLMRDMPREEELITTDQSSTLRAFGAIDLIKLADELWAAIATLSHIEEKRDTTLVKLGPTLEHALLSRDASIILGKLIELLEILTGQEVAFKRGEAI